MNRAEINARIMALRNELQAIAAEKNKLIDMIGKINKGISEIDVAKANTTEVINMFDEYYISNSDQVMNKKKDLSYVPTFIDVIIGTAERGVDQINMKINELENQIDNINSRIASLQRQRNNLEAK